MQVTNLVNSSHSKRKNRIVFWAENLFQTCNSICFCSVPTISASGLFFHSFEYTCFLSTQKDFTQINYNNKFLSCMNLWSPWSRIKYKKKNSQRKQINVEQEMVWMTIRHGRSRKFPYFFRRIIIIIFSFFFMNTIKFIPKRKRNRFILIRYK